MGTSRRRRAIDLLLVLLLCRGPTAAIAQASEGFLRSDPALARALDLEAKGESRAAAEAYRLWLDFHARLGGEAKDAPARGAYADVLLRFAALEPDARLVEHYLATAPVAVLSPSERLRIGIAQAELLDSLADVAGAQAAYEQAWREHPEQAGGEARRLLWRSASLLYAQGSLERAEAQVREALARSTAASDRELASACRYLLGRVCAALARPSEAEELWRAIAMEEPGSASAPGACLALWALCTALVRPEDAAGWLARLEERYPASPEVELARGARGEASRAGPAPEPAALFELYGIGAVSRPRSLPAVPATPPVSTASPAPVTGASAASTPSAADARAALVTVLAGSYTGRDNAEAHLRAVEAKGFAARVVETTVAGKRYYRVMVGEPGSYDAALELIEKLKDKDLESVPLLIDNK